MTEDKTRTPDYEPFFNESWRKWSVVCDRTGLTNKTPKQHFEAGWLAAYRDVLAELYLGMVREREAPSTGDLRGQRERQAWAAGWLASQRSIEDQILKLLAKRGEDR